MSPHPRPRSWRRRSRPPRPARRVAATLAAVASAAAVVLAVVLGDGAAPAGAHDGDAIVELEAAHPAGLQVHYIVRVTWENDGHPATDATVTATAIGSDGTQLTPVTLTPADADGRYEGVVAYPSAGTWALRLTSVEPTGTIEEAQEITTPASTEASETPPEVTTGEEGGFAPADDGTGDSVEAAGETSSAAATGGGGSDSGIPAWLIVAAAAVAVIGVVTAVGIIRRKGAPPAAGGDGGSSGGDTSGGDGGSADPADGSHGGDSTGAPGTGPASAAGHTAGG